MLYPIELWVPRSVEKLQANHRLRKRFLARNQVLTLTRDRFSIAISMHLASKGLPMNPHDMISGCSSCGVNRRRFLSHCAACVGAAGLFGAPALMGAAPPSAKTRIRVVYVLHAAKQDR